MQKLTLNKIRAAEPCKDGWEKLLLHLGKTKADDDPLSLKIVLESNGLNDTIWVMGSVCSMDKELRLFAVWCARQVQHLMTDPRSVKALDVAESFALGKATADELREAREVAWAAAAVAAAAREAAWVAAWEAAWVAARAAAWAAESTSAWAVAWTAESTSAWAVASQEAELLRMIIDLEKEQNHGA